MSAVANVRIGCAGWSVPREAAVLFPEEGSHLARYAARFDTVEINSSFYRRHQRKTYERWARSTPEGFRFAVKMPKTVTHQYRLAETETLVRDFLEEISGLGEKLGPVLVQLPPSFRYDGELVDRFFGDLRRRFSGPVVCEPRHGTWFDGEADRRLGTHGVGRVGADPAVCASARAPSAVGPRYWRLHGSPRTYWSVYEDDVLADAARDLLRATREGATAWCIFDNTALGASVPNALLTARYVRSAA